jgi:predicted nucleic acid-binding protein
MIVVPDASAGVDSVVNAESPYRDQLRRAELVITLEPIVAEVCSAFRKYMRAKIVSHDRAAVSVDAAIALIGTMQPLTELVSDVIELAARLETSVYDLFYLALALRTGDVLLTADRALQQTAIKAGVRVTTN